jgi:lysophospholipase L1-like esterase
MVDVENNPESIKRRSPANWKTKLILVTLSIVVSLSAAEILLRVMGRKYNGSTYTADPLLGWSLRPGSAAWETEEGVAWTQINSYGYRDQERTLEKPAGVYRVAVLGDSYTEARQVDLERGFTALAEKALNANHCLATGSLEMLNFGIPGYGTAQELILLRERVWQFKPDLVVLQFHSGNDIFNNERSLNPSASELAPYFVLTNGKLQLDNSFRSNNQFNPLRMRAKNAAANMMNRSVLLQLVYKTMRLVSQKRQQARLENPQTQAADPNALPSNYQKFLMFLPPSLPAMTEAWQVTEALVGEFGNEVRSKNVPLLLMILPTGPQINPDPAARDSYRARFNIESLEYADDRIELVARNQGIPVLRVTKPLIDEAQLAGTYMAGFSNTAPNDGHLNERGHAVVARELVGALCSLGQADHR